MKQEEYNEEAEKKTKEMNAAYRSIFTGPSGWLVFQDLIHGMDFWKVITQPNDAILTSFNDGRRTMALHIIQRLVESGVIKNQDDLLKPIFMPNEDSLVS